MMSEAYRAAREQAVLVEWPGRGRIAVEGGERASFLQGLLTNDIAALAPGTGCYAAYLTPQGRLITDMRVLELGDVLLLDVPPGTGAAVARRLESLVFAEDVRISDWTDSLALVGVHGPRAAELVSGFFAASAAEDEPAPEPDELARLQEYESRRWAFGEAAVIVVRSHELGLEGYDLFVPAGQVAAVRAALGKAGAREVDPEAIEVLRVEAGRPAFGIDMDEHTIPLEAAIEDRAISLTKGCFVGQEVIIRVLHRGHGRIAKRLSGLAVEPGARDAGDAVLAAGDEVFAGDRSVGRVTSAVYSPLRRQSIALGYLQRDFLATGTELAIDHEGRRWRATVSELPFVAFGHRGP